MLLETDIGIVRKPFWIRAERPHKIPDLPLRVAWPMRVRARRDARLLLRFHFFPAMLAQRF
jgi:hypothetical protein